MQFPIYSTINCVWRKTHICDRPTSTHGILKYHSLPANRKPKLLFTEFSPIAFIATTPTGANKLQPLCQNNAATLWVPESLSEISHVQIYKDSLKNHVTNLWENHQAIVFCLATGAVVRLISNLLKDKSTDPAVVVID
ncbi:MAG: hypothetical protein AAF915_30760, partial [Cyanobacteria bacterium P01_D01_bin.50]